jgi:hypothetical protein
MTYILGFNHQSRNILKKYDAYLSDGRIVSFGSKGYSQYHDKIGFYRDLDNLDKEKRKLYRKRHSNIITKDGRRAIDIRFRPAWFSLHYLW